MSDTIARGIAANARLKGLQNEAKITRNSANPKISNSGKTNKFITNQGTTKLIFDGSAANWLSISNSAKVTYPGDVKMLSASPPKFELPNLLLTSFHKVINLTVVDTDVLALWVWVDDPVALANIEFALCNSADHFQLAASNYTYKITGYQLMPGWNMIKFQKVDCILTGGATWGTFQSMRVRISPQNINQTNIPVVYLDSLVVNFLSEPIVLLNFDDSLISLYDNGYPYMQSKGIKGTMFFCSRNYNSDGSAVTGYMNKAAHDTIVASGWDMGNHSKTHNTVIDLLSNTNYVDQYGEFSYVHSILTGNKWTLDKPPIAFAAPNGKWNSVTMQILKDLGYKIARTSVYGFINVLDPDFSIVPTQEIQMATTLATMKKYVDDAIRLGTTVSIFSHGVKIGNVTDLYSMELSDFTQLIDYIMTKVAASQIKVMTFAEYYYRAFGTGEVQSKVNTGTAVPDSKTEGDFYIRLQTSPTQNEVYLKINGTWTKIGSLNV